MAKPKMRPRGSRVLVVIPDAHAMPGYSNERFEWLGRYCHDVDPDYIVCMGDWYDFPSGNRHDPLGSLPTLDASYNEDIEAGDDALALFHRHFRRRRARLHVTLGNHDVRPDLMAVADPKLLGKLGSQDLGFVKHGWQTTPYRECLSIEGILFSHHMTSGVAGRPIGGEHMAAHLVKKKHVSCVVGHSHIYQHFEHTRGDGQKIFGLSAGCYTHPEYGRDDQPRSTWCKDTVDLWWRGVVEMTLDGNGYYRRIEAIQQRELARRYRG